MSPGQPERGETSHARGLPLQRMAFHVFSNEGEPREPVHVHVSKSGADAKLWLFPNVEVA